MKKKPNRPGGSKTKAKSSLPSYWTGLGFIIGAVILKLLGNAFTGAMVDSTRGQGTGNILHMMNQAAKVRGTVDLIVTVLIIIGIIFMVRAFLIRSKAAKARHDLTPIQRDEKTP